MRLGLKKEKRAVDDDETFQEFPADVCRPFPLPDQGKKVCAGEKIQSETFGVHKTRNQDFIRRLHARAAGINPPRIKGVKRQPRKVIVIAHDRLDDPAEFFREDEFTVGAGKRKRCAGYALHESP